MVPDTLHLYEERQHSLLLVSKHGDERSKAKQAQKASSPSTAATAAPEITLSGGEAHHSSLVALWRKEKLTDTSPSAPRASSSRRTAQHWPLALTISLVSSTRACATQQTNSSDSTHALEGLRSPVLESLLAFVYEGSCEVDRTLGLF